MNKNVTTTSTSNVWISPNVLNLAGTSYIDILTDLPIASTNSATQNGNVLQRVSCTVSAFNMIYLNSSSFDFCQLLTTRLNNISLRLVDEYNQELDLNGMNWSICLEIRDVDDKGTA